MKKRMLAVLLAALAVSLASKTVAQDKPITEKESVTVKATVEAIDHDSRIITLKGDDGEYEDVYAGPEVRRFSEIKVGDKVTFKYTEAVVLDIRKPGQTLPPTSAAEAKITRHPTEKPSGTISNETSATVKVKAVDPKTGGVTVETENGRTMSFKVKDKAKLKDVNVGDRIVITYSTALLISVG